METGLDILILEDAADDAAEVRLTIDAGIDARAIELPERGRMVQRQHDARQDDGPARDAQAARRLPRPAHDAHLRCGGQLRGDADDPLDPRSRAEKDLTCT